MNRHDFDHDPTTKQFNGVPDDFVCLAIQEDDAYFKNDDVRHLDETLGDIGMTVRDFESLIVSELEDDILDCEGDLRATFTALARLDCILCLASCAHDMKLARPSIVGTDENCIVIDEGRHPLQELIVESKYISNSTHLDGDHRVNIVTGPNFSGKSTYLRQVGVIVYLSHIGSFVPCKGARISITDQILTRISAVETCAVPQSTFQLDLSQMGTILRKSTPSTLVLIDEFGKGTLFSPPPPPKRSRQDR